MTFDQWAAQRDFDPLERATAKLAWDAGYKASEDEFHAPLNTPASRSRAALPANIRRTLEASNLPIEVATAIADQCEAPDALALLRELNDALVIPGWLQPRVDAVLDRAEEKT